MVKIGINLKLLLDRKLNFFTWRSKFTSQIMLATAHFSVFGANTYSKLNIDYRRIHCKIDNIYLAIHLKLT